MSARSAWLAVILSLSVAATASAQRVGWVGELVMLREDGIRVGKVVGGELFRVGEPLNANEWHKVKSSRSGLLELADGEGWIMLSDAIRQREAEAYFTGRIKAEPQTGKWYGRRAVVLLEGFGGVTQSCKVEEFPSAFKPFRFDERTEAAIRDITDAARLDPECAIWRRELGFWLSSRGDNKAARQELEAATRLAPNDDRAFAQFAFHLFKLREIEAAMTAIDRAIELAPKHARHRVRRGVFLALQEQIPQAIAEFDEALKLDPNSVTALSQRGVLRAAGGELADALADFNRAIELDPADPSPLKNRIAVLDQKRDFRRVNQDLQTLVELAPTAENFRFRALILASCPDDTIRDGKLAVQLATKALELAGKDVTPSLYASLAAAHAANGEFDKAVGVQTKVIQMIEAEKPVDPDYLFDSKVRLILFRDKKPYLK